MDETSFDFRIRTFAVSVHRAPIAIPVRTSFGTMRDRPAVFLRVTDEAGLHGYGEVWCNFPTVAAEHRLRLAQEVVGPLLLEMAPFADGRVFARLMRRLHVLAVQSGEWGPLRQVSAGFDAAVHDLAARRAGVPLYRLLGGDAANPDIAAYASGIGPETPGETARRAAVAGHVAFKVKVGFGRNTDLASLDAMREAIPSGATLMADVNQGWTLDEALARSGDLAPYDLAWLEEPLRADRPLDEWKALSAHAPFPLAAGENINDEADFDAMMADRTIGFVQPDLAKWGGVSGCLDVAHRALPLGVTYCPHFLGGGVGLVASAHVLAAQGGGGLLEMDVNPNPLRDELTRGVLALSNGRITLGDAPGIGMCPDHLFA